MMLKFSFCSRSLISYNMYLRKRCPRTILCGVLLLVAFSILVFEMLPFHSEEHTTQSLNRWREQGSSAVKSREVSLSELFEQFSKNPVASSAERLESVSRVCDDTKKPWLSLSAVEKRLLYKHIIVNDEHRVLFCYVPKAACANWKRVMMVLDGKVSDSNEVVKVNHKAFTFLEDLPPLEAQRKLKEYYKFMFVREPLSRLWSAYKDKFLLNHSTSFHEHYGKRIVKKFRKDGDANTKGNDVTLTEFLQFLEQSNELEMNEHWMPYYKLCQPCAVSYNFIGSFENLQHDAVQVLKDLNVDEQVSFPKQQPYYKSGGTGFATMDKAYAPTSILQRVLKKYALDYEMFSYTMPDI